MLESVIKAVEEAGKAIKDIYLSGDFDIQLKSDNSPLTLADKTAHSILVNNLTKLDAGPILSEEGLMVDWEQRKKWTQYWLIDPLDGTKEFINRNGEFTINVALIRNGEAILGVVYAPILDICYTAVKGKGAYKREGHSAYTPVTPSSPPYNRPWKIVGSRSHSSLDFDHFLKAFSNYELTSVGSSLKLCMIAEGAADLYPRLIPTNEWDTAAAQAIVEAAGGIVINWPNKDRLIYNAKDSLLNPYFIVCANPATVEMVLELTAGI